MDERLSVMLGDVREQAERLMLTVEAAYNGAEYVCDVRTHQGKLVFDSCSVREVSAYIKGRQHEEQRWVAAFDGYAKGCSEECVDGDAVVREQLLAEKTQLERMLACLPDSCVIDRMSLEARLLQVDRELAKLG